MIVYYNQLQGNSSWNLKFEKHLHLYKWLCKNFIPKGVVWLTCSFNLRGWPEILCVNWSLWYLFYKNQHVYNNLITVYISSVIFPIIYTFILLPEITNEYMKNKLKKENPFDPQNSPQNTDIVTIKHLCSQDPICCKHVAVF